MRFAAAWGLTFQCDPMAVLGADELDLSVLSAVLTVAQERLRKAREEVSGG